MTPLIFFGSSIFSVTVLQKLLDRASSTEYRISAVVTTPDKPAGRGLKLTPNPVTAFALQQGLHIQYSMSNIQLQPNFIGLVAAYGKIIPQFILDKFNNQIYNIHPSLLPKYRGPSPLQQQIMDGVKQTGVTLIQLDSQMDHGPIVAAQKDIILPDDTWITLGHRLFSLGTDLFINLQDIGCQTPRPQDESQATFTRKITRQDGFIPWLDFELSLKCTPQTPNIRRMHSAFAVWPGVWSINPQGVRIKLISLNPPTVQLEGKSPTPWRP
jgi:methionyl-tRNA formyltransferase